MTIKSTPPISFLDVIAEFGGAIANSVALMSYYRGGSRVPVTVANVPATGAISLYDFLGTRKSVPGSQNYDSPGTFTFAVPAYLTMMVIVAGAGGGGATSVWDGGSFVGAGTAGPSGNESTFLALKAGGGGGGGAANGARYPYQVYPGAAGSPGGAAGGDVNTPGGGSVGGAGGSLVPIGGGSNGDGGVGGAGGLVTRTYNIGDAGAPTIGQTITLVVGAGGGATPGNPGPSNTAAPGDPGEAGKPGYVHVSWT